MTEMKRLLDHGATGFEAILLGQAAEEQPSDVGLARMLAVLPGTVVAAGSALAAGSVVAVETSTVTAGTISSTSVSSVASVAGAATRWTAGAGASSMSVWGIAGVGVVLGSLLIAGFWGTQGDEAVTEAPPNSALDAKLKAGAASTLIHESPSRHGDRAELGRSAELGRAAELGRSAELGRAEVRSNEERSIVQDAPVRLSPGVQSPSPDQRFVTSRSSRSVASQASSGEVKSDVSGVISSRVVPSAQAESSSLREEISLLEAVRAHIAGGDQAAAFAGLNRYRAKFPQGTLATEARTLDLRARSLPSGK